MALRKPLEDFYVEYSPASLTDAGRALMEAMEKEKDAQIIHLGHALGCKVCGDLALWDKRLKKAMKAEKKWRKKYKSLKQVCW